MITAQRTPGRRKPYEFSSSTVFHSEVIMKRIISVMVVLMFISAMAFTNLALADRPADKGKVPMSDKSKEGKKLSEDAKAKAKAKAKSHGADMRSMDEKQKEKDKLKKKGEGKMKSKRF
jgi:preprotein translocase subunit SecG